MDEHGRPGSGGQPHRPWRGALRFTGLAALALGALGACSSASTLRKHEHEADLAELGTWLPGVYDDSLQVRAEEKAGGVPRDALLVVIVPVYTPSIGDHVFFAESMLASNTQRVISEQLLSFALNGEGLIVQTNYALKDPLRWRSAYATPEMFEGLQAPDLKGIVGCPLAWSRGEDRFTATNDRHSCRPHVPTRAGGAATRPKPADPTKEPTGPVVAELTADEYAVLRRVPDAATGAPGAAGAPAAAAAVAGTSLDPLERYRKRVQP